MEMIEREVTAKNWDEFQDCLNKLNAGREKWLGDFPSSSIFLYRGQRKKEWGLDTTLERYLGKKFPYSFNAYLHIMRAIRPEIESFTNTKWVFTPLSVSKKVLDSKDVLSIQQKDLEFMIYIRHHGFPSPLLDWSKSPYIAAYFAFRDSETIDDMASIYVLWEKPLGGKFESHGDNTANIISVPPEIRTHKRHFLQQCQYTYCGGPALKSWHFKSHDAVLKRDNFYKENDQNSLWKINIPSSQKYIFLKRLDGLNITGHSLFGTEEALMETLAFREFKFE